MTDPFEQVARQDKDLGPAITAAENRLFSRVYGMRERRRALFDESGQPIVDRKVIDATYSRGGTLDQEAGAALAEFRKNLLKAAAPASRDLADAERSLQESEAQDPFSTLGPTDLARASALKDFVADVSDRVGPADLALRLRGIVAEGNRAAAAVYGVYAGNRLERERAKAIEGGHTFGDSGIHELEEALKAVEPIALGKAEVEHRKRLRVIIGHNDAILTGLGAVRRKWDQEDIRQRFQIDPDKPKWKWLFEAAGIDDSLSVPTGVP